MAAAGTLGADSCPGPPSTAILPAPSPSSSDTSRMSATTNSLLPISTPASASAKLNRSARRLTTARCPCPFPCPSAPAATSSALPALASACPPLSPPSPVPAAAPSPFCRPVARGPSRLTVSGLSGDEGDDTSADVAQDAGKGVCGASSACMRATSALTPTSPGPPYPLTAGGWLGFGSGLWDIVLHTMVSRLSPEPCRRFPRHPRPPPPLFAYPTCALGAPRLLFPVHSPAYCGHCQVVVGLVLDCTVVVLVPAPLATLLLSACVSWYPLLLPAR